MAHRQKYLAGENPALTLEEAYWRVISTITEVDDLTYVCTTTGFTTPNQRLEADNLHRMLVDQNIYLRDVWRNEANIEKLYNTRELIQIIDEDVLAKLEAMKDAIVSLPGSAPCPRLPSPPPMRSSTRQRREETLENHYTGERSNVDKIKRTMVYTDDHKQAHECQQHSYSVKTEPTNRINASPRPPNTSRTT